MKQEREYREYNLKALESSNAKLQSLKEELAKVEKEYGIHHFKYTLAFERVSIASKYNFELRQQIEKPNRYFDNSIEMDPSFIPHF